MKVADIIKRYSEAGSPFWGVEYFLPTAGDGVDKLLSRIHRMAEWGPAYISITHAGGLAEFKRLVDIGNEAQKVSGVVVVAHLASVAMTVEDVKEALDYAKAHSIRNLMAVRGNEPATAAAAEEREGVGAIACARDLVAMIKELHGDYFCVGVAGHPESSLSDPVQWLAAKVKAGAEFIVSEFFFDVDSFNVWHASVKEAGINVPVIPAVLPIQSFDSFTKLTRSCKVRVPPSVSTSVALIMSSTPCVRDYGVELSLSMCRKLGAADAPGVHFISLNLEASIRRILRGLNVISNEGNGKLRKFPWRESAAAGREEEGVRPIFWANRPGSYLDRTASWSKFPNARWEGEQASSFSKLPEAGKQPNRCGSCETRKAMWGDNPVTVEDVYEVFAKYVEGTCKCLPWCEAELALETKQLIDRLARINRGGFLTINSQPRVNGAPSDDPVFGWGGAGGYVYQKAYVECFTSAANLAKLLEVVKKYPSITFTAVDVNGHTYSNCPTRGVQAVTWGVFPSKEILQPTVVDFESFLVWKDEAFALWTDRWASMYAEDSAGHELLHDIHDKFFLVNLVDHDFIAGDLFAVFDEIVKPDPLAGAGAGTVHAVGDSIAAAST